MFDRNNYYNTMSCSLQYPPVARVSCRPIARNFGEHFEVQDFDQDAYSR